MQDRAVQTLDRLREAALPRLGSKVESNLPLVEVRHDSENLSVRLRRSRRCPRPICGRGTADLPINREGAVTPLSPAERRRLELLRPLRAPTDISRSEISHCGEDGPK